MRLLPLWSALLLATATLVGCVDNNDPTSGKKNGPEGSPPAGTSRAAPGPFDGKLLEVAQTYEEYGWVDNRLRWAPVYCAAPATTEQIEGNDLRVSASLDAGTHGRKLYAVFARYATGTSYVFTPEKANRVGQVVVKESWIPEEVKDAQPGERKPSEPRKHKRRIGGGTGKENFEHADTWRPYALRDGKLYHAGQKGDLFIMLKLDPGTPDTDNGWVYGTVTPDGKTVTSAGRVESCMKCHLKAPHDRLFGLPKP
jgi:hypothetical protein